MYTVSCIYRCKLIYLESRIIIGSILLVAMIKYTYCYGEKLYNHNLINNIDKDISLR